MSSTTRRTAVLGMAAGLAVWGTPLRAMPALRLPDGPMRLRRRVERGLRGGAMLVVEREWEVLFQRQGRGAAITGRQLVAQVDAPDSLEALARIEQSRSTDSMFPILLSDQGTILASGPYVLQNDVDKAVNEAERMIKKSPSSAEAKNEQLRFLGLLQKSASGMLQRLPSDLFFPVSPPTRSVLPVALPEGLAGEFEVTYEARGSTDATWLERAERTVVTRIGASERRSREVWTMRPA